MKLEQTRFLQGLHGSQVRERRIKEVVGLAGEKLKRIGLGACAVPGLLGRDKLRNRVKSLRDQSAVVQFGFAARRLESPLREGEKRSGFSTGRLPTGEV